MSDTILSSEQKELCNHLIDIMEKTHMRGERVELGVFEYDLLVNTTKQIVHNGYYSSGTGTTLNELRKKYIHELRKRY